MLTNSAYIHIPFCQQLCHYCDFSKVYVKNQPVDAYIDALATEMEMTKGTVRVPLDTLYIGGGTPSVLNKKQAERLFAHIHHHFEIGPQTEWTFEANPNDVTHQIAQVWLDAGVNRISLGVQSFDDRVLKAIGRTHKKEDVAQAMRILREVGFTNISLDLMYALPEQTMESYTHTLNEAVALQPDHLSVYSLILEPKTVFYIRHQKGKLTLPDNEMEAVMYEHTMDKLNAAGYKQYEISNYGRAGRESRHNQVYWRNESYFGFGVGSHSYVDGVRIGNVGVIPHYIQQIAEGKRPIREEHAITDEQKMEEEMFLGLRMLNGVCKETFEEKYGQSMEQIFKQTIADLKEENLLIEENGHVRLTRKGLLLGNDVFSAFLI
ncbi:MAG: radical SAM family heme chaperone HemW [Bacilli bacterium]